MTMRNLIFGAALTALLVLGGAARAAESVTATLMNVEGDVQTRKSVSAKWTDANNGAKLTDGYEVKTGKDGEAVISWGLGNVVRVYPLTEISVDKLSDDAGDTTSELKLGKGRAMAQVGKLKSNKSHFNIKTPTAVAGVRGTSFDMNISGGDDKLSVSVLEGAVSLEAGGVEIMLEAGFETIIAMNEPFAAPAEIPIARLDELRSAATELKEISEKTGGGGGQSQKGDSKGGDSKTESATESVTETITIQNQALTTPDVGCTGGGGCIEGEIRIK